MGGLYKLSPQTPAITDETNSEGKVPECLAGTCGVKSPLNITRILIHGILNLLVDAHVILNS